MILQGNQRTATQGVPVINLRTDFTGGHHTMDRAATASALAFLEGELEKREPKLLEPLTSTTWPRDIAVAMGGGWVERVSSYNVGYGSAGAEESGLGRGATNDIPTINVNTSKDWWDVFTFLRKIHVPLVDQNLLRTAGRSLDEMLTNGLHLDYDKSVDKNVYIGFAGLGTYGIVNNPNVVVASVPAGVSGGTTWVSKTVREILDDINQIMNETWENSEYDLKGMANHILIPPAQYAFLVSQFVSEAGNQSILNFLLENNIGRNQGVNLAIFPCRWLKDQGTGGTDRMVAYANHRDNIEFDMTVPLTRTIIQASADHHAYISTYAAQFSQVKFKRLQPVSYYDGI